MLIEVSLYNNTSSIFNSYVEFQKCANSYLDEIKNINISDIKSLEEKNMRIIVMILMEMQI